MHHTQVRHGIIGLMLAFGASVSLASCTCASPESDEALTPAASEGRQQMKRAKRKRGAGGARKTQEREAGHVGQKQPPGKWRRVEIPELNAELGEDEQAVLAQLEAIGYADGTREVSARDVITRWDKDRSDDGLNLWCSGHAAAAYLSTMDGTVLHTWAADWSTVFPSSNRSSDGTGTHHYRRVHLADDGSLYVIFEGRGIAKLSRDSEVLWAKQNRAHHDVALLDNGGVLVLARAMQLNPKVSEEHVVVEDWIQELDRDGQPVRSISLLEAFENSEFAHIWHEKKRPEKERDLFHTNSLELLDGSVADKHPAFQKGRVLVSMRTLNAIAVVDLDEEKVVWAHQGVYRRQHDPKILSTGDLMLFDNGGRQKHSHVRVYRLPSMEETWTFSGSAAEPFRSATLGTAQLLGNRNVLITESDGGRAFEVTEDGAIVWEFYNPHRAGDDGSYIAALFELERLPETRVSSWLTSE
ncbi:MAG: arylsulfotransferase family protein [Myxococcota bacterium]